jgi:16S rRNA A1518/A1519 N6-dimethyltransferase RsmA/KsgA/DIM1 with predicted DNA glycosylase/AP lyase activity
VLQVGGGTGYYTAILVEIVGPSGRVTALEIDEGLAARARQNLAGFPSVEVVHADGTTYASAGRTRSSSTQEPLIRNPHGSIASRRVGGSCFRSRGRVPRVTS